MELIYLVDELRPWHVAWIGGFLLAMGIVYLDLRRLFRAIRERLL